MMSVDYKAINFKADLKNAKRTAGDTVIQLSAKGKDVDMNLLGEIMDANGGVKVTIESNQTELVKDNHEADGQTELLGEDD
ncbi:MAG: hypothetical protein ACLUB8_01055 [Limosilactobacillus vaginalis]|uniref:Uncharacterized protein n=2 Tax=Limosilactobacillus TaxID=2742598 RepID=A0AAW5WUT4_9LACO|nr:hypothetical protein [Limosilactobacillus vaginalis]MCZ3668466.1 hypothetical protein [Limosilactobacillus vaginalis]PMC27375.1 hypothetical protein CJ225_05960 [Gardnerella vaginalis]